MMIQNNSFLSSLKQEQTLELEFEEMRDQNFHLKQALSEAQGVKEWFEKHSLSAPNEVLEKINTLATKWLESEEKLAKKFRQWRKIRDEINSGNLRHVVYSLYTERGFTEQEFASEIGCTESEIVNLTSRGSVTEELLDEICSYFEIRKTTSFTRYL